jgi:hypothetical protein
VPVLAGGAPGRGGRRPWVPGIVGHLLVPGGGALTAALREVREDMCHGGDPFPVRLLTWANALVGRDARSS